MAQVTKVTFPSAAWLKCKLVMTALMQGRSSPEEHFPLIRVHTTTFHFLKLSVVVTNLLGNYFSYYPHVQIHLQVTRPPSNSHGLRNPTTNRRSTVLGASSAPNPLKSSHIGKPLSSELRIVKVLHTTDT